MIFKKYKPTTPSLRHLKLLKKEKELSFNSPLKNKIFIKKKFAGRNNQGKITIYQKGGGRKKLYRKIDFLRNNLKGVVQKIEYDPNRTAFIGRIFNFIEKKYFYILASSNLKRGDYIQSGINSSLQEGNNLPLSNIPVGFFIHNLSIKPNSNGQFIRSAGTFCQLIQKDINFAKIKLPSGEQRLVSIKNSSTLGIVSNLNNRYIILGKAGRSRWKNKRPIVRGVAMNPVDHPHGGGEGKTSGEKSP